MKRFVFFILKVFWLHAVIIDEVCVNHHSLRLRRWWDKFTDIYTIHKLFFIYFFS